VAKFKEALIPEILPKIKLTNKQISNLKSKARLFNYYNFFGRVFTIGSNSRDFLKTFDSMYKRFRVPGRGIVRNAHKDEIYYFILPSKNGNGFFIRDDEIYQSSNKELFTAFANMVILRDILSNTKGYFLVHASTISFNNNGIILAGSESKGKTTTTMELTRRGFKFLSDEIAAINISDGLIHPFPRSLTLCDGTLKIFKIKNLKKLTPFPLMDGTKMIGDIEDIYPNLIVGVGRASPYRKSTNSVGVGTVRTRQKSIIGMPCNPKYLIFLKNRLEDNDKKKNENRGLFLILSNLSDDLLGELKRIDGIEKILVKTTYSYPSLELSIKRDALVVEEIEELCSKYQSLIIYCTDEFANINDFNKTPELKPVGKSEAIKELMKNFIGRSYMNLVQDEFQGSLSLMLVGLADLLKDVKCYNLKVGRLNKMADLICELVQKGRE